MSQRYASITSNMSMLNKTVEKFAAGASPVAPCGYLRGKFQTYDTLAPPRGCTCNYDLTHISVQALDTSQEGSGCSLLPRILRLCQSVFKTLLIENPSSVEVRAVIRFLNAKQK
jgi:hypothetical protein